MSENLWVGWAGVLCQIYLTSKQVDYCCIIINILTQQLVR